MGFLDDIGDVLLGSDKQIQVATAPGPPLGRLITAQQRRLAGALQDPRLSETFRARRANIRQAAALGKSDVIRQVEELFARERGGLAQGARGKLQLKATGDIDEKRIEAEREALAKSSEFDQQSFLKLLEILSRFRASTFASEVASIRTEREPGLFDIISGAGEAATSIAGGAKAIGSL